MASEEARDWRTGLSLQERQRYMYEGKYACDVTLRVGKDNPEKIAAHRFVLVCGSPVFETMLTEGREGDIVVGDVEPEVFNAVLKFLYCEQIELKVDTVMDVLQAARKYEVSQLVVKCSDYLMDSLDVHNVCLYLTKSVQYDENELFAGCMNFFSHNAKHVLDSTEFTGIPHQSLKRILESDLTNCVSPRCVYTACLRWADTLCTVEAKPLTDGNRRAALGSCLYLIRFPDMSNKEFIEVTRGSKLLTNDERLQIFEYISYREHGYEYEGPMVFNAEKSEEEYRVSRFKGRIVFGEWGEAETNAIDFQCNRNVWIAGVGLYCLSAVSDTVVKLMDDEGKVLADTGNVVMEESYYLTCDVLFPERVRILADQLYRITAEYKSKQYLYGMEGRETVKKGDVTFTFRQTPGNKTTVDQGQIPVIIFAT